ncbi:MAG: hypothetical protein H7301_14860 [Cryobacterium sp.]|nr:hypothetical protein [Oligoflexia bacterium]
MNLKSVLFSFLTVCGTVLVTGLVTASVAVSGICASSSAQASSFPGFSSSLSSRDDLVQDLAHGRVKEAAASTLDHLVLASLDALEREGEPALAARYRKRWEKEFNHGLSIRLSEVGDHAPLSQFLATLYRVLSGTIGKKAEYAVLLADLNTMNYAIPVVFAPKGEWRGGRNAGDDRDDYRDHFVPFAGIVTFYTTLGACQTLANSQGMGAIGARLCPRAADVLNREMREKVAPKLSDYIFNRANGIDTLLKLTRRDFAYLNVRDLQIAVDRAR